MIIQLDPSAINRQGLEDRQDKPLSTRKLGKVGARESLAEMLHRRLHRVPSAREIEREEALSRALRTLLRGPS